MKKRVLSAIAVAVAATMLCGSVVGCGGAADSDSAAPADAAPAADSSAPTEAAPAVGGDVAVDEWKIPVLSAVTGPIAFVGAPASWSAQYAVDQINAEGGICGVPVSIDIYDTKFDTAEVASCLSQVVDDSIIVVGPMDAPGGEVAGQMIFDAAVPNIGTYSYEDSRAAYTPYAIAYMTDSEEGDLMAIEKWIERETDIKKIAFFFTPSDASQVAALELVKGAAADLGIEIVAEIEVETDTLDCGPAAVQALNAGADGYYMGLRADEAAKIVTELRTRGVDEGRKICATFACFSENYYNVVGAANIEGSYIWNKLDPDYDGEEWNTLCTAYEEEFGNRPSGNPVPDYYNAFKAIKLCFEELQITGATENRDAEKQAIAEWLNNSPEIEGIQGPFHWENGKKIADVYFFQFEGDKPVAVK